MKEEIKPLLTFRFKDIPSEEKRNELGEKLKEQFKEYKVILLFGENVSVSTEFENKYIDAYMDMEKIYLWMKKNDIIKCVDEPDKDFCEEYGVDMGSIAAMIVSKLKEGK